MAKTLDEAGVKRLIQEIKGANKNLNTPIHISTENTPESMSQNVKNIADYVAKAKAAGIANVNGMAVTCLIDGGGYSGVGYLNGDTDTSICAIEIFDDSSNPMYFRVDLDGTYEEVQIIMENSVNIVTSDMLVEGARKPIIFTTETTEVDEETYQKLLNDDVDVIADFGKGIFIESQAKFNMGDTLNLIFGFSQFDESNDGVISTYTISINTSAPHTLTLAVIGACMPVSKSILTPVLQEIDLRGTDAERKAKLEKFETDWKALTGASDLTGARFVGNLNTTDGGLSTILTWNADSSQYEGIGFDDVAVGYKIKVNNASGSLIITPLFSHLEAITIYTDNTPEHMQANLDNIATYEANLQALGVDTNRGFLVPISCGDLQGYVISRNSVQNSPYVGYISNGTTVEDCKNVLIQPTTGQVYTYTLGLKKDVDNVKTDVAALERDLDSTMIQVASPDDRALPLLCGQPPILFGAGTPKESIVPDNWNQYDPTTGEGYNWNGKPSAIGQQYVDTTAASGGRYIAVRNGEWDLKWINC